MSTTESLPDIEKYILTVRARRVVLDATLAELFGVEEEAIVQAVKRNPARFPEDFAFLLTRQEATDLRCQDVTSESSDCTLPYAFTEQGIAMVSGLLNSERAIRVSIEIMRTFVGIRKVLASNHEWVQRLDELEKSYDAQFRVVFDAIRQLMTPSDSKRRRIGFLQSEEHTSSNNKEPES